MVVFCYFCDKKFHRRPSEVKAKNFCSKKCYSNWRSAKFEVECGYCSEIINASRYKIEQLEKGELQNLFCNKKCLSNWQKEEFKKEAKLFRNRCPHCKEYYKTKNKNQRFCSQECLSDSRKINVILICDFCGGNFTKKPAQVRDKNFCTKQCSLDWNSKFNNLQITKTCWSCKKKYKVTRTRGKSSVCCSKDCLNIWKSKHYPNTEKGKEHLKRSGINSMKKQKYSETKPERMVSKYLKENEIGYIPQNEMYDKFIVDFYLPDQNIVIEVLGDYWHGNPIFYGDGTGLKPLTDRQLKQSKKDKARYAYLTKCGHEVHMIWENDIYKNIGTALSFLNVK